MVRASEIVLQRFHRDPLVSTLKVYVSGSNKIQTLLIVENEKMCFS